MAETKYKYDANGNWIPDLEGLGDSNNLIIQPNRNDIPAITGYNYNNSGNVPASSKSYLDAVNAPSTSGLGSMYSGTIDGKSFTGDESYLDKFDAGSIDSANVNGTNYGSDTSSGFDLGSFGKEYGDTITAGVGLGQLGLGVASYLDAKKSNKKRNQLLDQQLATNQYEFDTKKNIANKFTGTSNA